MRAADLELASGGAVGLVGIPKRVLFQGNRTHSLLRSGGPSQRRMASCSTGPGFDPKRASTTVSRSPTSALYTFGAHCVEVDVDAATTVPARAARVVRPRRGPPNRSGELRRIGRGGFVQGMGYALTKARCTGMTRDGSQPHAHPLQDPQHPRRAGGHCTQSCWKTPNHASACRHRGHRRAFAGRRRAAIANAVRDATGVRLRRFR